MTWPRWPDTSTISQLEPRDLGGQVVIGTPMLEHAEHQPNIPELVISGRRRIPSIGGADRGVIEVWKGEWFIRDGIPLLRIFLIYP